MANASAGAGREPSPSVDGSGDGSASWAGGLPRLLVVGCGNLLAGDDGAGVEVVERLVEAGVKDCQFCFMPLGGVDLLEMFPAAEIILFVDAVASGAPAGTIHLVPLAARDSKRGDEDTGRGRGGLRPPAGGQSPPLRAPADDEDTTGGDGESPGRPATVVVRRAVGSLSSHGLGLLEALELACALGRHVPRVMLLGVEIGAVTLGAQRSPAVARALTTIAQNFSRLQALLVDGESALWCSARQFPPNSDSFPGEP